MPHKHVLGKHFESFLSSLFVRVEQTIARHTKQTILKGHVVLPKFIKRLNMVHSAKYINPCWQSTEKQSNLGKVHGASSRKTPTFIALHIDIDINVCVPRRPISFLCPFPKSSTRAEIMSLIKKAIKFVPALSSQLAFSAPFA